MFIVQLFIFGKVFSEILFNEAHDSSLSKLSCVCARFFHSSLFFVYCSYIVYEYIKFIIFCTLKLQFETFSFWILSQKQCSQMIRALSCKYGLNKHCHYHMIRFFFFGFEREKRKKIKKMGTCVHKEFNRYSLLTMILFSEHFRTMEIYAFMENILDRKE